MAWSTLAFLSPLPATPTLPRSPPAYLSPGPLQCSNSAKAPHSPSHPQVLLSGGCHPLGPRDTNSPGTRKSHAHLLFSRWSTVPPPVPTPLQTLCNLAPDTYCLGLLTSNFTFPNRAASSLRKEKTSCLLFTRAPCNQKWARILPNAQFLLPLLRWGHDCGWTCGSTEASPLGGSRG